MAGVGVSAHLEHHIHDRSRLRDLPMDSSGIRSRRRVGEVDDEVADAPEEVVLVHIPLRTASTRDVGIRIWETTIQTQSIPSNHGR